MSVADPFGPRASFVDVLRGRARLVGARAAEGSPRGYVSPVEARWLLGLLYDDAAGAERAYLGATRSAVRDVGVLARTALARALTPSGPRAELARPWIVSSRVDNVTVAQTLAQLIEPAPRDRARMVHFVHPHALNVAAQSEALRAMLRRADLVLPDGVGLRIAAALLGVRLAQNVNGTDLLPLLCDACVARDMPLALVGAAPGVAQACADRLAQAHPGLRFAAIEHGFIDDAGARAFAERVRAQGPCVVLVAMGTPTQERWAWRWLADIGGATVLTVGGLFDFYSGRIPRAPQALRDAGLEWTYRLYREPRRLAKRYLLGNPLFVARALAQRARGPRPT